MYPSLVVNVVMEFGKHGYNDSVLSAPVMTYIRSFNVAILFTVRSIIFAGSKSCDMF